METRTLKVGGMSCGGCADRVSAVLRRLDGVREVVADHTTGRVEVRVGADAPDRQVLEDRIVAAGFEVLEETGR